MDNSNEQRIKILLSHGHGERLPLPETGGEDGEFSRLYQMLAGAGYLIQPTPAPLSSEKLVDAQLIVIGGPEEDLTAEEVEVVKRFIEEGGDVLLIGDGGTRVDLLPKLSSVLLDTMGLALREYHNYPPTFLQEFRPHYVTAGVRRVQVGRTACLEPEGAAIPLAWTRATGQVIMSCAEPKEGRILVVSDLNWLADDLLTTHDNARLARNVFDWLARRNPIDVLEVDIPGSVKWGESVTVTLQMRNRRPVGRPQVECVLESDADAVIEEPIRKRRSIPPETSTEMRWTVHPQVLGNQKLRLTIHVDEGESLYFDDLQMVKCLAPGYLTLEIKGAAGEQRTSFDTGDLLTAEGAFHWDGEEQQAYHLELETEEGLIRRGYEEGHGIGRWHLQTVAPGQHRLTLSLVETEQSLPAMVRVKPSVADRRDEIRAAYVYPLDAEIAERLRRIDARLSQLGITEQPFIILSPEEFVQEVYAEKDVSWLQGVLAAARREQYQNFELLDLFLTHIAPTYLPSRGTFIPYDPALASDLAELHPTDRRYLEYNLLQIEESEDIAIKQNVAAYLLHEKYGHGFFYAETRLGRQLALLLRHGVFGQGSGSEWESYRRIARDIKDSAIIVNEGFATWLELTFLAKLDREIRQAAYPRRVLLVEEATGLSDRQRRSDFFQAFPSRFDSPYREGFEYLDLIGRKLDPRCAIRAFVMATDVDLGIAENAQGHLEFELGPSQIRERLFGPDPDWRSQARLRMIAELLYNNVDEIRTLLREQRCPTDCRRSGCPFEVFVEEELDWRSS